MNKRLYGLNDLLILLFGFIFISLVAIYNAQQLEQYGGENFLLKQMFWFVLGLVLIGLIQLIDLGTIHFLSFYLYLAGIFLLVILYFSPEAIAPEINNAKSWFRIGGITFQPSELVKITTIVYLASTISKHKEKHKNKNVKNDLKLLLKLILIGVFPVGIIILQPDFGTAMVYLAITGGIIFLSGINWKIISSAILFFVLAVGMIGMMVVKFPDFTQATLHIAPYQMDRIETWLGFSESDADDSFHFKRSILAIGSGQLTGKGISNSEVYIPEAQTDFIFSIIGETFGFTGCAIVILLYFLLIFKLVSLGLKIHQNNEFGAFICFGYLILLFIHTFQNIGMTIGVMPITGIPLLLISYGGSSVLSAMIGYALIIKVNSEQARMDNSLFR
ncbi:rod shape determining protein RodA [Sediminibacillus albus]|uniref:Rod shape determining protein RodA n=1 Tax=Sediminibacillus albus TaxID=407036 RepID=A0A1G9APY0_9BACI|nr:FtsW/RodA/SpoVE family cell cycle protein [Sediminibacillus albus]SDK28640.1 rod shape determining protein RodA [Sediminibacillus albus]